MQGRIPSTNENYNTLIDKLTLPQKDQTKVRVAIHDIVLKLQQACLRIDRVAVGGSFKKKTALVHDFDVDLVLMVNNAHSNALEFVKAKEKLLSDVEDCLTLLGIEHSFTSTHCISFRYKEVHFDTLVGLNACDTKTKSPLAQKECLLKILEHPSMDDKRKRSLSCSFTESSVQYVKKQPLEVIKAIMLAKYWKSNGTLVTSSQWKRLRSYATELMVIKAFSEGNQKSMSAC